MGREVGKGKVGSLEECSRGPIPSFQPLLSTCWESRGLGAESCCGACGAFMFVASGSPRRGGQGLGQAVF